jgi:hypothetical protein
MPAGGLTATAASGAPGVTPECRRQETALRGGFFFVRVPCLGARMLSAHHECEQSLSGATAGGR